MLLVSKILSPSLRTNLTLSSVPGRPDEGEMFLELVIDKCYSENMNADRYIDPCQLGLNGEVTAVDFSGNRALDLEAVPSEP